MAFDAGSIISTLEVDRSPFQQGLRLARQEGAEFGREKWSAKLDLDAAAFTAKLEQVKAQLQALTGRSLNADLDIAAALGKVATLQAAMDGLRAPTLRIDIDLDGVLGELAALEGLLSGLRGRVDIDTSGVAAAQAEIAALRAEVDRLGGRTDVDVNVNDRGSTARTGSLMRSLLSTILFLAPAVIPAGAAIAGAMAAAGTGAALALGGIGALVLGVQGVGGAYSALGDQQKNASKVAGQTAASQQAAASATAAAQQQLEGAERSLAQTRESGADAADRAAKQVLDARRAAERGVSQALARQQTAERSYSVAVRDAERAQESLTQARVDAKRAIEDLQFSVLGGALAERRAVLQLQDATDALNEARQRGATGRELEDATLGYEEAALAVDELRVRNGRLRDEKASSDRAGVDGSRQVVAANEQIAAANERVAEADRGRGEAAAAVDEARREGLERMAEALANQERTARQNSYAMTSALEGVESAQQAVAQASQRAGQVGVDANTAVTDALAALTPEGREFVRFLDSEMRPALKGIKDEAQSNLLPGLQRGLDAALPALPRVSDLIGNLAFNIGGLGERAGNALGDPFWVDYFNFLRQRAGPDTQQFGTIFGNTMQGVAGVSQGAVPIWQQMGDGLERMTDRFAAFGAQAASGQHEEFNEWLDYVERVGPKVIGFFGDVGSILLDFGQALAPAGEMIMDFTAGVADFIDSVPEPVLQGIAMSAWAIAGGFAALGPVKILLGGLGVLAAASAVGVATLATALGSMGLANVATRLVGLATFLTGPWGIALGVATAALGFLWVAHQNAADAAKQQEEAEKNFRDALVASTGIVDENVRSTVQKSIADQTLANSGDALLATTDALGISQGQLTDAIISGGKPLDDIRAKLEAARDAGTRYVADAQSTTGELVPVYTDASIAAGDALSAVDGLSQGYREQEQAALVIRAAINGITVEQQKQRDATIAAQDALMASIGADLSKEEALLRLESGQARYNEAVAQYGPDSLQAREAGAQLDRTYLNLITQAGEAAAKQGEMNGVLDTGAIRSAAMNREALLLADSLDGPVPEAVQKLIDGMSLTDLKAAGATVRIDETGQAVARLPSGKEVVINAATSQADDELRRFRDQWNNYIINFKPKFSDPLEAINDLRRRLGQPMFGSLAAARAADDGVGFSGGGLVGVPRFASGGVVGGYGPGVDDVPALLSRGEAVLVPELVRMIGPETILAWNKAASGRNPTIVGAAGGTPRFAAGGIVGGARTAAAGPSLQAAGTPVDAAATEQATDAVQALSEATTLLTPLVDAATLAGIAHRDAQQQLVAAGLTPLADELAGRTFPALTETAQLAGDVDVAAVQALQGSLGPLRDGFAFTADTVGATMGRSTGDIERWRQLSDQAMLGVQAGLGQTRQAMEGTATWARLQFGAMQAHAANPIRWIINNPLGDPGLIGAWNSLDAQFQLGRHVNRHVPGFAEGGPIRGRGGPTSDEIPALLSNGEFVVRAAVATRVPHFLDALNDGQAEAIQAAGGSGARMPAFAAGGPVTDSMNRARQVAARMDGKPYRWGGAGPEGADCSGYQSIITNALRGEANPYRRIGTTATFPWPGFASGLGGSYAVGSFKGNPGHMASTLGGTNAEAGGSPSRVKFGAQASGADHPRFTTRAFLPQVGGQFVSGGMSGAPFDPTPMVDEAMAATLRMINDEVPRLFGTSPHVARAQGVAGQAAEAVTGRGVEALQTMFASSGGGGNVEQWRGVVNQALTMKGLPLSLAGSTLRRMNQESGGNPNAINNWDINAINGVPSVGLMQVIGPTYRAHRDRRHDVGPYVHGTSVNPLSNVLASMGYAMNRYGSLPRAYDRAGGYDNGGPLEPGDTLVRNRSGRTENVLNAEQGAALRDRIRGGDGAAQFVAEMREMTERIEAAVREARTIHVHPRADQSEESIAAATQRRLEEDRRLL